MAKRSPYIRATTLDYLDVKQAKMLHDSVGRPHPGTQALIRRIGADRFSPTPAKESYWGMEASWTSSDNQTLKYEFVLQAYKRGSDQACILIETLNVGTQHIVYPSYLVAPRGNYSRIIEFYADARNNVRAAHSKMSRFKKCVKKKCGAAAAGALVGCSGSFWAYVACVAVVLGSCMALCGACAVCHCGTPCKWFVGCCKN